MEKLKTSERWIFGIGSLSKDLIQSMFSVYLLVFYTDVFGIGAAAAGILLMVARIWDAVINPVVGLTIDNTRTKWGRCRPYLLIMPIPFVVFSILTFTVPSLSMSGKIIYAYVTYILAGTFFTFMDVSIWSLLPALTTNLKERSSMISLARIFTKVGMLAVSTFAMPIILFLGGANVSRGYTLFAIIIGILSVIFAWLVFFNTKERVTINNTEKPKLKDQIGVLAKNKYIFLVIFGVFMNFFAVGIENSVGVYHISYYLGQPSLIPTYMLIINICSIGAMAISGQIIKKLGNKQTAFYFFTLSAIVTMVLFFIPPQNVFLMFTLMGVASAVSGIIMIATLGMLAEMVDYTELKVGIKANGLIFSLNSLAIQCGFAVSAGIAGVLLQYAGYVPKAPIQSSNALLWINLLRTLLPGILFILPAVLFKLYPIGKKQVEEMSEELEKLRSI